MIGLKKGTVNLCNHKKNGGLKQKEQLQYVSKEPINKGWSSDKKYCVTADDGIKYLLRVSPEEKSINRAEMFHIQQHLTAFGVSMCKPIEFGSCDEGVYTLQTWVQGKDAEEIRGQRDRAFVPILF